MGLIDDIKLTLSITVDDQDPLINLIIKRTEERLCSRLQTDKTPLELEFIVFEVAIKRYNRIDNEGMQSYSAEGENITFNEDDFAEFENDINSYLKRQSQNPQPKIKFINPYEMGS